MIYTHCPRLIKTSNPLITAANMASVVASALALLAACPLLASATHEYPDCANGPLKNNSVCDTSLPAKVRAQAFVDALTFHEKINITSNWSPGVERDWASNRTTGGAKLSMDLQTLPALSSMTPANGRMPPRSHSRLQWPRRLTMP